MQSSATLWLVSIFCVFVAAAYSKPIFPSKYHHGLASGDYPPMSAPVSHSILTSVSPTVVAPVPVVAVVAPVAPSSAMVPVTISQSKPIVAISQPVIHQPQYAVPQQVLHQPQYTVSQPVIHQPQYVSQPVLNTPVITEVQKVVRRPVIAEVQEVVHKPYLTGYQHTIKLPKYTTPILQKPDYSLVHREPAVFSSDQYHLVNTPSQMAHLPPQFVQSGATGVLLPSVHHGGTQTITHPAAIVPVSAQPVPVAPATGSLVPPVVSCNSCPPPTSYGFAGNYGGYGQKYGYQHGPSRGYLH